jgi:hypothetical protein
MVWQGHSQLSIPFTGTQITVSGAMCSLEGFPPDPWGGPFIRKFSFFAKKNMTSERTSMNDYRNHLLMRTLRSRMFLAALLLLGCPLFFVATTQAQFAPRGGLDCNGLSKIQKPIKAHDICTDFRTPGGVGAEARGEDNGVYIGHDEPSVGFYSNARHSGNNMQWEITLPRERPLPATQTFENYIAFWFALALCDPGSFPNGPCIPSSDANDPNQAGSAFLEMQFYPPGNPPFITQISCDLRHWCASLHINSLEVTSNFQLNPNCTEPTNFAFIQRDGVPTGPPGPASQTDASFTPNSKTLLMNQGDRLRITILDIPGNVHGGVLTFIEDLTTGQTGFMVASAANGYQSLNPDTCAPTAFSFHPEFGTAKYGNFVPWAALQANVNFAAEIGHFTAGANGDNDADDGPCFPGPTVAGCLNFFQGGDIDFDGNSYLFDWPDGTRHNATSLLITSRWGGGIGPRSVGLGGYTRPYPQMQIETDVGASESTCTPSGSGCVVPPTGAQFYPYYSVVTGGGESENCTLVFGNIHGPGVNTFGGEAQYGPPNLPWFFGTNSSGVQPTPCSGN